MTPDQQIQFRAAFKAVVYQKGLVKQNAMHLGRLHSWDKDGSHQKAIKTALNKRDKLKAKLKELLNGKEYEEWVAFSKRLSSLNTRFKSATNAKANAQKAIKKLSFPV